eukprot:scaffold21227_cov23-Prasinocladus_malaysianus.AAC.1
MDDRRAPLSIVNQIQLIRGTHDVLCKHDREGTIYVLAVIASMYKNRGQGRLHLSCVVLVIIVSKLVEATITSITSNKHAVYCIV